MEGGEGMELILERQDMSMVESASCFCLDICNCDDCGNCGYDGCSSVSYD